MLKIFKNTLFAFFISTLIVGAVEARVRFITDIFEEEPRPNIPISTKRPCEQKGYLSRPQKESSCETIKVGSNICFTNCVKKENNCKDLGYHEQIPQDHKCSEVQVGEKTCYNNCKNICESQNYRKAIPDGKKCDTFNIEGVSCYANCTSITCEELGYSSRPKKDKKCFDIPYFEKTCYNCLGIEEICNNGGYLHYVPPMNRCTETTYLTVKCYTDCKNISCSDIGYYDREQSNMECTRVVINESYSNCYECKKYNCSDGGYSETKPNDKTCDEVTYKGLKCFNLNTCKSNAPKSCKDGGYLSYIPENKECSKVTYVGLECYKNCKEVKPEPPKNIKSCDEVGYQSYVPVNHRCTQENIGNLTCYSNCYKIR